MNFPHLRNIVRPRGLTLVTVVVLLTASSSAALLGAPTASSVGLLSSAGPTGAAQIPDAAADAGPSAQDRAGNGSTPDAQDAAPGASSANQQNMSAVIAAMTASTGSPAGDAPTSALTAAPASSSCPVTSGVATCTFSATGTTALFTVPLGVSAVTATLTGASSAGQAAGAGGQLQVVIPVTTGQTLALATGVAGSGTTGGFPDGGSAGTRKGAATGCAGGGGSRISFSGASDVAEAGGGGGCGGDGSGSNRGGSAGAGGDPGSDAGKGGGHCPGHGGGGATAAANGGGGSHGGTCRGVLGNATTGNAGSGHGGGDGGAGSTKETDGGGSGAGGGGGWFGGGGGGGGGQYGSAGGGGGGGSNGWDSSLATQQNVNATGVNSGDGSITLTYPVATTVTAVTLSPNNQTVAGSVTATVAVTAGGNAVTAGGTAVAITGAGTCKSVTLDASGTGSCTFPAAPNSASVGATFPTTGAYLTSSASTGLIVSPDPTKTTVGTITTTPTTATVPVTVALDHQSWGTIAGKVTVSTPGSPQSCTVAVQSAAPATSAQVSCTVTGLTAGSSNIFQAGYAPTDDTTASSKGDGNARQALFTTAVTATRPTTGTYGTPVIVTDISIQATDATTLGGTVTVYDSATGVNPIPGQLNIPADAVALCSGLKLTSTGGGSFAPSSSTSCSGQPLPGNNYLFAAYSGDGRSKPSQTTATALKTQPADTSVTLSGQAGGNPVPQSVTSNTVITLDAAVTYGSPTVDVSSPAVDFYDGTVKVCAATTGSCQVRPTLAGGATHTYTAKFTGLSGKLNPSPASNAIVVGVNAPGATLTISASPKTVAAGGSATLTVDFATKATTAPSGTVTISSTQGQTVCTPGPLVNASFSCTVSPPPGSTTSYQAGYTGDPVYGTVQTTANASVTVSAAGSSTVMNSVSGSYGSPVTLTVTVTSKVTSVTPAGTVTFSSAGNQLCSGTLASTTDGVATASCATALPVGNPDITATFPGSTTVAGSTSAAVTPTITAASTQTTVAATLIGFQTASLTATVALSSGSGSVSGTVEFFDPDKNPITGCTAQPVSAGTASCPSTAAPATAGTYDYTATFTGADNGSGASNTAASSGTGVLEVATGSCSGGFQAFYDSLKTSTTPTLGSGFASLPTSVDPTKIPAVCDAGTPIPFTADKQSPTLPSLFKTIDVTADLTGSVSQNGVCITGGTFGPTSDAAWLKVSSLKLAAAICFTLDADGAKLDRILSGQLLSASGQPVPLVNLAHLGTVSIGLTFSEPNGTPTLSFSTTLDDASSTGPSATLQGTVAKSGDLTAALSTANLTLFGAAVNLAGSISRTSGTVTYSASATLAGPLSPSGAPGISLSDLDITLDGNGLEVKGTGTLGSTSHELAATFILTAADTQKWSATLTTDGSAWQPLKGQSLNASTTGTLSYDATATPTYDYDLTFTNNPAVKWSNSSGADVEVNTLELSSTATCPQAAAGDPILSLTASASIDKLSADQTGCADLATSSFSLAGQTTSALAFGAVDIPVVTMTLAGSDTAATFTGTADGTVTVNGKVAPFTTHIEASSGTNGQLVIAGTIDLTSIGLPTGASDGFVAYASGPVTAYPTGFAAPGPSAADLVAGVTAIGFVVLPSSVQDDLKALGDNQDATLKFVATLSRTAGASFTTTLNLPTLKLFTLTLTDVTGVAAYDHGLLSFTVTAQLPSESGTASLALKLSYDSGNALTGTASLTNLSVFGTTLTLNGSISRSGGGLSGSLTLSPITLTLPAGITVKNFTATLATGSGVSLSGTVSVPGAGVGLTLSGSFTNLRNYSASVSGTLKGWSPTSGVSIGQAVLDGAIASATTPAQGSTPAKTTTTLDLKATGDLFSINPVDAVGMSVTGIELSNGAAGSGCTVAAQGDLWLGITGSLSVKIGHTATADAVGCFDLTADDLSLSGSVPLDYSALDNTVTLVDPQVTVAKTEVKGTPVFSATAQAKLTVSFTTPFTVSAAVQFRHGDDFIVGAGIALSHYLPHTSAVNGAYLIYSTAAVNNVDSTPFGGFGSISLAAGLDIAGQVSAPADFADALGKIGIKLSSSDTLFAVGTLDLAAGTATLDVNVDLGVNGQHLFDTNGTRVTLTQGQLQLSIAPTLVAFGVKVNATMTMQAPVSDSCNNTSNTVPLTGLVQLSDADLDASLSVGGWNDALGICGLNVADFTVQVGVGLDDGIPTLGLSVDVTGLPSKLASTIGYVQGTPLSMALNISPDEFLVAISIGTKGQTTPALKPLTAFGKPNLIVVDYASLYISPDGATVGNTTYPAGYALALDSTVDGVALDLDIAVDPNTPSLNMNATLGQVKTGSLTFGPTTVVLNAAPHSYKFELDGSINLGPSTLDAKVVRFTGQLSASIAVSLGTDGLSAQITASADIQGSDDVARKACFYKHVLPYPCDFHWVNDKALKVPKFTTGIDVNSSGVDVTIPDTTKTLHFPFSSNHKAASSSPSPSGASGLRAAGTAFRAAAVTATEPDAQPAATDDESTPPPARPLVLTPPAPTIKDAVGYRGYVAGEIRPGVTTSQVSDNSQTAGQATWLAVPSMNESRAFAATAALGDGSVLMAGGANDGVILSSAEVYHPATMTWTATGSLLQARAGASVVKLADGRVLVVGGSNATDELISAEIYDPASGTWSSAGSLQVGRQLASAVRLADGRVLVAGGRGPGDQPLASAEMFDPATTTWSMVAPLAQARMFAAASLLPNGRVLVASGLNAAGPMTSSEVFDPATEMWSTTGPIANARFGAAATTLADGQVLLSGGSAFDEVYTPATGVWSRSGTEYTSRSFSGTVKLSDGRVLTAGGVSGGSTSTDTEIFNPDLGLWAVSEPLPVAGFGVHASALADGRALFTGGQTGRVAHADSFVYIPDDNSGGGGGSNASGSGGGGEGGGGGMLPNTGASVPVGPSVLLGLLLVLVGCMMLYSASGRRRRV